jgi:phosphatidate cytidylyltransferase
MAFNWQTFRVRALTAIVFVVVMAVGLLWSPWSFFGLFTFVHFGCWREYNRLIDKINPDYKDVTPLHRLLLAIAGWCLLLYFTNNDLHIGNVRLTEVGLWLGLVMLLALPLLMVVGERRFLIKNSGYALVGLLYISLSFGLLVDMRNGWVEEEYRLGLSVPLAIIFTLWINDTMAYIVGSLIGKTPLSPISPKKTWEGTIGGIILAIVVVSLIAYFTGRLPVIHAAVIAALAAITGTYGDLFESKLKRLAGVKDSGAVMPGHGGFLDRFDSLLFASTVVWFYVIWFV